MGNRLIKESVCISEQIDELDWFEEVFFYRLIVNCDDYGVMDARLKILKAKLFPLKDLTLDDISRAVSTLVRIGLIRVYEVDGKPFLKLIKWEDHQRVRNSKHKYPVEDEMEDEQDGGDLRQVAASCGENTQTAENGGSRVRARAAAESESESNPNPNTNPNPTRRRAETDTGFDSFWAEYPKKVKKPEALKAWAKLKPEDGGVFEKVMEGLRRWKASDQWTRDGGRFIPNPATWINNRQWEDEVRGAARPVSVVNAQAYAQRDYSGEDEEALRRWAEMPDREAL